ncbi:FHA domain-containing protein [Timonella sp. A28]|uniref:FHA domain-containing protein n=1 Tax=Timonella sp. A28 TaxID=3442640 RepID=UPI003EBE2BC9
MSEHMPLHRQRFNEAEHPSDSTMTFTSLSALDEAFNVAGASPEVRDAVNALPMGSALLVVRTAAGNGERFLLDADRVFAGRSERADVFLNDVTVSRKHAEFVRAGADYEVRDAGSLNGTYINRDRIDSYVLKTGDEIQIGKYRMVYYNSPLARAPQVTPTQTNE